MPKIVFVEPGGKRHEVEAKAGQSLMEAALGAMVPGIAAECLGSCSCATCHVYIGEEWLEKAGRPSEMEEDMLDFAVGVRANSRLSCQVRITDEMDGMIVTIPARQY